MAGAVVYIVSGGMESSGEQLARTALAQFGELLAAVGAGRPGER